MKRFLLSLFVAACVVVPSVAQEMGPPVELKKLEWFLGEWTGKVKYTFPGEDPTEGEMAFKNEREANFLKSTSKFKMMGTDFVEIGYIAYNAKDKCYCSWTFTNFAPLPRIEHGTLDGDTVTFVSEPWEVGMPGGPTTGRATLKKKSDKEMTFTLEFKEGDKWNKVGEGTFTKKATTP